MSVSKLDIDVHVGFRLTVEVKGYPVNGKV